MTANRKINITSDGGVQKEILKEGTGEKTPFEGCRVSLHYTGKFPNGTVFESSNDTGQPLEFCVGKGVAIKAIDLAVATMKLGEKCIVTCSSKYAFGRLGCLPKVPPNSTIIYELEMLGWIDEDISPGCDGSIERIILENGDRKRAPKDGAFVKAHITGKHEEKVFEDRDVNFNLGEGSDIGIVEGVEIALGKMGVGEVSRVKIKSKYAFGSRGNDQLNIPPNSTIEYTIRLNNCENVKSLWTCSEEEVLEQAKICKEKGTKYFKKENYLLANKMYKKCYDMLCDRTCKESNELIVAACCNRALCYQKTNDYYKGKSMCNLVLKREPNNLKALYRRGRFNLATGEYEEAMADFQRVLKVDPLNKAAQNQIQICKHKLKLGNDKEKKIYTDMFAKLAAANEEEDLPNEADVLSKCGEWTDEDTRREVDRAFERDNNIVMI